MAKTSKTTRKTRIENPFVREWKGEESKGSILFAALAKKNGADLREVAEQMDSSLATVRVRVAMLAREYTIEKIGGYGEPVYRLVA